MIDHDHPHPALRLLVRDHRTPLVPLLRLVRCEGPHLARGLR